MIIKIDCRERELLEIMKPAPAPSSAAATEPDHYLMDLGDGVTMKVPILKKTNATMTKTKKSLATVATNHEIKSERLPLGDIILHDPAGQGQGQGQGRDIVLFERKTLNDLAASIQDGRYKEQSFRLLQQSTATATATTAAGFHPHNIVYIIEGDIGQYEAKRNKNNRITKTALQSAMVSLLYYKGFSVIRTMNLGETADFIIHFADKVAKESADGGATPAYTRANAHTQLEHYTDTESATVAHDTAERYSEVASKKEKRDYITRENIGEIMLAQVPGVSPKVATAILAKYDGSLYEFLGDLHRKIANYEESVSPLALEIEATETTQAQNTQQVQTPMNKNKLKHVSECFKDVTMDGKRGIGKATIEKLCYFLS